MAGQTVKVSFPQGTNVLVIYGGSFNVREYEAAYPHESNISQKSLRITFYKTMDEAKAKHGENARKLYTTYPSNAKAPENPTLPFRSLQLPTRKFLNIEREKNYKFSGIEVPAYIIETTETSATIDIDLTGSDVTTAIKLGTRKPQTPATPVRTISMDSVAVNTSKSAKGTHTPTKRSEVKPVAKPATVSKVAGAPVITLSGELTIADLKRMGFEITLKDSADQPFMIKTL